MKNVKKMRKEKGTHTHNNNISPTYLRMSFEQEKNVKKKFLFFALMENVGKIENRVNIVHSSGRFHKEGLNIFSMQIILEPGVILFYQFLSLICRYQGDELFYVGKTKKKVNLEIKFFFSGVEYNLTVYKT